MSKIVKHFTVIVPENALVKTRYEHTGNLHIDAIAYAQSKYDEESYDYDVDAYRFEDLNGNFTDNTAYIKAKVLSKDLNYHEEIMKGVWNIIRNGEEDTVTEVKQDHPNIFGHCDSDSAIPLNSEPIVSTENHAA